MLQPLRLNTRRNNLDSFIDSTFRSLVRPTFGYYNYCNPQVDRNRAIPVDLCEEDDNVVIWAEIPGSTANDLKVELVKDTLLIESTVHEPSSSSEDFVIKERSGGSVSRIINLPCSVDADSATSTYKDGVLEVTLPKVEKSLTTRIPIS